MSCNLLFQNCSQTKFTSDASSTAPASTGAGAGTGTGTGNATGQLNQPNTAANSCYTFLHSTSAPVKMFFVVDQSGSNADPNGTDPQKTVRGGSIQKFFDDYKAKTNFSWGMIGFAADSTNTFVFGSNASTPGFTNNLTTMQTAINTFNSDVDFGNTPYQLALNQTIAAIAGDSTPTSNTKYIVVWLSDGMPNPSLPDTTLTADVQTILSTRPGQVTFNTVFYGDQDPLASGRLSLMAQTGNGHFLDTNLATTGKDFLISNIVTVPGSSCVP